MFRSLFTTLAFLLPTAVSAQTVIDCQGWQSSAQNIVEPWTEFSRTYANGDIRIALLDTVEPAAGAFYLLVMSPPYDELGSRICALVAEGDGSVGFSGIDFAAQEASYDPATGLTITLPIQRYDAARADFIDAWLAVTINQATGAILARTW